MTPVVGAGFEWHDGAAGRTLRYAPLLRVAPHLFTTRARSFSAETADDDWRRVAGELSVDPSRLTSVRQVHGRRVLTVANGSVAVARQAGAAGLVEADAVVMLDAGWGAAVRVADCVPILLADDEQRVVAAAHAGWRGTCAGIAAETVRTIADAGVDPARLTAAIGPAIGPCCYQVDDKVRTAFLGMTPDAAPWFAEDGPGRWRLDLLQANVDQLEGAGVPHESIGLAGICTADHPDICFSYRREGGAAGRLVAAIRLGA